MVACVFVSLVLYLYAYSSPNAIIWSYSHSALYLDAPTHTVHGWFLWVLLYGVTGRPLASFTAVHSICADSKIILTQILRESLWDNIKIGQVIDGKVRDNKSFGTLISLDDETMGLIHTSELEKIGRKFQPEQELKVKVLAVDRANRKIFLTVA